MIPVDFATSDAEYSAGELSWDPQIRTTTSRLCLCIMERLLVRHIWSSLYTLFYYDETVGFLLPGHVSRAAFQWLAAITQLDGIAHSSLNSKSGRSDLITVETP